MEGLMQQVGDPIPDTYNEVCERLKSTKEELEKLQTETNSPEKEEKFRVLVGAKEKLEAKQKTMEEEIEKLKPLKTKAEKVFSFSNPKKAQIVKEWGIIQNTAGWMETGEKIVTAKEQGDTNRVIENLNILAELSRKNLNKKEFKTGTLGSIQNSIIEDIKKLLQFIEEYQTQNTPIPWNKI